MYKFKGHGMFRVAVSLFLVFSVNFSVSASAAVYKCIGSNFGDTKPAEVFPDNLVFDTNVKDDLGGPQFFGPNLVFMHKVGGTVRQTNLFTKAGKATVKALRSGKERGYKCTKE